MKERRFKVVSEGFKALKRGDINLLILIGEPGMAKSYSVKQHFENAVFSNCYSTPLSLYETLHKHKQNKIIVFDDLEGLDNNITTSLLKSACWSVLSDKKRKVSWFSTSKALEDKGLPEEFDFNSKIILIFNKPLPNFKAVISRGFKINMDFSFEEKLFIFF